MIINNLLYSQLRVKEDQLKLVTFNREQKVQRLTQREDEASGEVWSEQADIG